MLKVLGAVRGLVKVRTGTHRLSRSHFRNPVTLIPSIFATLPTLTNCSSINQSPSIMILYHRVWHHFFKQFKPPCQLVYLGQVRGQDGTRVGDVPSEG